MKILTIRQPWAWMIVNGYKDVENRTWATRERGLILIHAGKAMTRKEYSNALAFVAERFPEDWHLCFPKMDVLQFGGIVGEAVITGCVTRSESKWFAGPFGFTLGYTRTTPFRPMKGALGFWEEKKFDE